jgi:hypothetical protein
VAGLTENKTKPANRTWGEIGNSIYAIEFGNTPEFEQCHQKCDDRNSPFNSHLYIHFLGAKAPLEITMVSQ